MNKYCILILTVLTMVLTGCGVTRTLEPPCPETALQPFPTNWLGDWTVTEIDKSKAATGHLKLSAIPDQPAIAAELKFDGKSWPPLMGVLFHAGDKRFLVAWADTEDLLMLAGYNTDATILFQPVFLLFEITGSSKNPEIHTVTFVRKSGNDYLPVSDALRLKDHSLVLNSTAEIYALLESGEYEIARKYRLDRPDELKTPPNPPVSANPAP